MRAMLLFRGATIAALLAPLAACALGPAAKSRRSVAQRRGRLQRRAADGPEAIPFLAAALDDENPLLRRQAARLLLEMGAPARGVLIGAMDNPDLLVRRTALKITWKLPTDDALPYLEKALKDESVLVRQAAVSRLVAIRPQTKAVQKLVEQASKDEADSVRLPALKAIWPFHRENVSIRDRHYDHDIQVVQTIRLPKGGWRFRLDPKRDGHKLGWFKADFDDAKWRLIAIEQAWQKAGVQYIGVAWYRRWIELPPKPKKMIAAELHFLGVDESAWVWVNGIYVGQHDMGPQGWDQPFRLGVAKELKWGARNHITVRAMNTAHAGGIWRPVEIEVLK